MMYVMYLLFSDDVFTGARAVQPVTSDGSNRKSCSFWLVISLRYRLYNVTRHNKEETTIATSISCLLYLTLSFKYFGSHY